MLSVKFLEVEPIAGVLQELSIRVNEGVCPFFKATVDNVIDCHDDVFVTISRNGVDCHEVNFPFAEGPDCDYGV